MERIVFSACFQKFAPELVWYKSSKRPLAACQRLPVLFLVSARRCCCLCRKHAISTTSCFHFKCHCRKVQFARMHFCIRFATLDSWCMRKHLLSIRNSNAMCAVLDFVADVGVNVGVWICMSSFGQTSCELCDEPAQRALGVKSNQFI